jgi:tRNA threonylcarbamoyladenosine modification (KEOPS) complex  Pcc1 subunit
VTFIKRPHKEKSSPNKKALFAKEGGSKALAFETGDLRYPEAKLRNQTPIRLNPPALARHLLFQRRQKALFAKEGGSIALAIETGDLEKLKTNSEQDSNPLNPPALARHLLLQRRQKALFAKEGGSIALAIETGDLNPVLRNFI